MLELNKLLSLDRQAQQFIKSIVKEGEIAIDATAGNGYDSLFLAKLVGKNGAIYAFDIQKEALQNTRAKLAAENCLEQVQLVNLSHDQASKFILAQTTRPVAAIMFNLGFLPGSDKSIYTKSDSTLKACETLLPLLRTHGMMTIHAYTGKHNSQDEAKTIITWAKNLPWKAWDVCQCSQLNKTKNMEYLICIQRLAYVKKIT